MNPLKYIGAIALLWKLTCCLAIFTQWLTVFSNHILYIWLSISHILYVVRAISYF